jgi:hypothetical protein
MSERELFLLHTLEKLEDLETRKDYQTYLLSVYNKHLHDTSRHIDKKSIAITKNMIPCIQQNILLLEKEIKDITNR